MRVRRFASPGDFLAEAGPDLALAEVENNLILGSAHDLTRWGRPTGPSPYFSAVLDGERVLISAFRTLPGKIGVTRCFRPDAVKPLAEDAWDACPEISAVIGPAETAGAFADALSAVTGRTVRCHSRQRIFELHSLQPPSPAPAGMFRAARHDEVDLLTRWSDGFFAAISESGDSRGLVLGGMAAESLFVWDHHGAVSMAAAAGRTRRTVRVAHVYTPPEHRGHGYATACVAALSRHLLEEGSERCCLYSDVTNDASNAIYRRLGYEPICDVTRYVF
jgi:RimJ/RimL family protein N-acetyltransferase